jgi:hypothetical protein
MIPSQYYEDLDVQKIRYGTGTGSTVRATFAYGSQIEFSKLDHDGIDETFFDDFFRIHLFSN